ncbi:MAG: protein kinase, partial [Phycisphaerae bacterium]|nr:protein kinase [Phycisphaerae bacterium]
MTTDRPSSHDAETAPVSARSTSSAEAISRLLAAEKIPDKVGEYRILKQIGAGGMGLVYLAQRGDSTFSQTVALKVIKKGMDSEEIVRRFELERQLLSGLNHPNIARLIDGGTTEDGRPFFALEYVDGQPIDKYCDANKLSTRDRLALFRKVCAAVHYAHQNLIVHRDLKPGNVLINAQGEPKLLDFGIAKLLNPTLFQAIAVTGAAVRLMTPEYASPEQVKGESITTASDIYSLGVMLYELLTGRRPYKFKTRLQQEIIRIVCEEAPERPSTVISRSDEEPVGEGKTRRIDPTTVAETREGDLDRLRRRLRGDIDDIVLKAMDKAPTRRYASAEQFSEDIARHLTGEPVIARPPSALYRAGKFIQRNRGKVTAAAAVALALLLGAVGTSVQWARAEQARSVAVMARNEEARQRAEADAARLREADARKKAEEDRDLAEKSYRDTWDVLSSYINEVHAAVTRLPDAVEAREIIVETASKKMQNLADLWKTDAQKQQIVAGGFERLGQLSSDIRGGSKGGTAKAMAYQQTALTIRREFLKAKPDDPERQLAVASSLIRIADLHALMNDRSLQKESYEEARALLEPIAADRPQARPMLAAVLGQLGDLQRDAGDLPGATAFYERGQALRESIRDAAVADA